MEALVREHLSDQGRTEATVRLFMDKVMEQEALSFDGEPALRDDYLKVMRHALETFYPSAVKCVYAHAGSPIEKIFLNSLILSFLFADPLGLMFTEPHKDVLGSLEEYRRPRRTMLEVDQEMGNPPGEPRGFLLRLQHLLDSGKVSKVEYETSRTDYLFAHGLGFWHAFNITPQAGFPHLHARADLFVCIPGDETLKLIVECDGYQFHSSKDAFTADRRRDRLFKSHGIDTFRFSGSEIYRNPADAGVELFEYLQGVRKDSSVADTGIGGDSNPHLDA